MTDRLLADRLEEADETFGPAPSREELFESALRASDPWENAVPPTDEDYAASVRPGRPDGQDRTAGQASVQSARPGGQTSDGRSFKGDSLSVQSASLEDPDSGHCWSWVSAIKVPERRADETPVENLVELGKLCCLIGDGGVGKSTLTEQVAAGLATGFLWGQPLPRSYAVVLVNTEDDRADIRRSILAAAGVAGPRVAVWVPAGELAVGDLATVLDETGAEVVFVNPLIDLLKPSQENDNSEIAAKLYPFKRLCLDRRVCIVFVHHTNKSEASGRNKARGASALFDHCALFAELRCTKEGESWTLFFEKRRGGPKRKPLALRSNGSHFEPTEYIPPQTVATSVERAILDLLHSEPGRWFRAAEIEEALKYVGKRTTIYERLKVARVRRDVDYDDTHGTYRYRPAGDPGAPAPTDADAPPDMQPEDRKVADAMLSVFSGARVVSVGKPKP